MRNPRARTSALSVALVAGVVACSVAAPVSTPLDPSAAATGLARPSSTSAISVPPAEAAASPDPSPGFQSPYRLDLEIHTIDAAWIWPMLDFASDHFAIIYSSGVLDGPTGHTAPDLWRYEPGADKPELLWRNPDRDRQLAKVAGDTNVWAFAEISSQGEHWWNLWLLLEPGGDPILLDEHPGGEDVPSLVPSFDVDDGRVAWSSFGRGASGDVVSRLWIAEAPAWEPCLLAERPAAERALWLPSLYGGRVAYVDVIIGADPSLDERRVLLMDLATPEAEPLRLDTSGNATMPILTADAVIWKEPDEGFAMFNWGRLYRYTFATRKVTTVNLGPQEYVNYPSGDGRWVAMWGADSSKLSVYDLELGLMRPVLTYDNAVDSILRPTVSGDLLVWLHSTDDGPGNGPPAPLEYAILPEPGSDRGN